MPTLGKVIGVEVFDQLIELVQQLLEPELVHLMNDDEQRLVVFRRIGLALLQAEQIVDAEVVL